MYPVFWTLLFELNNIFTEADVLQSVAAYNNRQPYYRRMWKTWLYPGGLPYTSSGKLHRSRLEREYEETLSHIKEVGE